MRIKLNEKKESFIIIMGFLIGCIACFVLGGIVSYNYYNRKYETVSEKVLACTSKDKKSCLVMYFLEEDLSKKETLRSMFEQSNGTPLLDNE